jgi:arabinogalactan endo-1,4-beta-galactosidase
LQRPSARLRREARNVGRERHAGQTPLHPRRDGRLISLPEPCGAAQAAEPPIYLGVDISYANEMDDCGAVYKSGGASVDQFRFFKSAGANVARIRIWNDPDWTKYSNLADVKRSIRRAKQAGLQVLLDFHYSDDWADGDKQIAPKAWAKLSTPDQAKALYAFTHDTLTR